MIKVSKTKPIFAQRRKCYQKRKNVNKSWKLSIDLFDLNQKSITVVTGTCSSQKCQRFD